MMKDCKFPFLEKKRRLILEVYTQKNNVERAKSHIDTKVKERNEVTSGGKSSRERSRIISHRLINTDSIQEINLEIVAAKAVLKEKKQEVRKAEIILK